MSQPVDLLRQCIAAVHVDGYFAGSGFFIGQDRLLTCAHVVGAAARAESAGRTTVVWQGRTLIATVETVIPVDPGDDDFWPLPDLAVLVIAEAIALPSAWLGTVELRTGAWVSGHGFSLRTLTAGPAEDTVAVRVVGVSGGLLKVTGDAIPPGMSGGAVLDRESGRVIGLIKATRDRDAALGGWIIPMPVIAEHLPGLVAANTSLHRPGTAWRDGATRRTEVARELFRRSGFAPSPPPTEEPRPSWWLDPKNRVTEFQARPEFDTLRDWCLREPAYTSTAYLLHGGGGVGKTRLALELCDLVDRDGWVAGFLPVGFDVAVIDDAVRLGHRVLAVLDYAETRAEELEQLLSQAPRWAGKVRVLLLARSDGRWWHRLAAGHQALVDHEAVLPLRAIGGDEAAARRTLTAAFRDFSLAIRQVEEPLAEGVLNHARAGDSALTLHVLALDEVLRRAEPEPVRPRRVYRPGSLRSMVDREARNWQRVADRSGLRTAAADWLLEPVLAVATLYPARSVDAAVAAMSRALISCGGPVDEAAGLVHVLRRLYPDPAGVWASLTPDRLGETLVVGVLQEMGESAARRYVTAVLADVDAEQLEQIMVILWRAWSGAAPEQRGLVADAVDALATSRPNVVLPTGCRTALQSAEAPELLAVLQRHAEQADLDTLTAMQDDLDRYDQAVAPLGEQVARLLLAMLPAEFTSRDAGTRTDAERRAGTLQRRGNWLVQLGRFAEAESDLRAAVDLLRSFAGDAPATIEPVLAHTLSDLAWVLAHHRVRPDEALSPTHEAVGLYRRLAARDAEFRPGLGGALVNLAEWLQQTRRPRDAARAVAEAIQIYRDLVPADPSRYESILASLLAFLGYLLHDAGRDDEALTALTESAELQRPLLSVALGATGRGLAEALVTTGRILADQQRYAPAEAAAEEARELFQRLAEDLGADVRVPMADCLMLLADLYAATGQFVRYAAVAAEAIVLHRALAENDPEYFGALLSHSLAHLYVALQSTDAPGDQLDALMDEIVVRSRLLASTVPVHGELAFIHVLLDMSDRLSATDRLPGALDLLREAVGVGRAAFGRDPEAFTDPLVRSLMRLAELYGDAAQFLDAIPVAQEAVALCDAFGQPDRLDDRYLLVVALTRLSAALTGSGNVPAAIIHARRVISVLEGTTLDDEPGYITGIRESMTDAIQAFEDEDARGDRASSALDQEAPVPAAGQRAAADAAGVAALAGCFREAWDLLARREPTAAALNGVRDALAQVLAVGDGEHAAILLSNALLDGAEALWSDGHVDDAATLLERGIEVFRSLAVGNRIDFEYALAVALTEFARQRADAGGLDEANVLVTEAVFLLRRVSSHLPVVVPMLASALSLHAHLLAGSGQEREALPALREAVVLGRQIVADDPLRVGPEWRQQVKDLMSMLDSYRQLAAGLGRAEEAHAVAVERLGWLKNLSEGSTEPLARDLFHEAMNLVDRASGTPGYESALTESARYARLLHEDGDADMTAVKVAVLAGLAALTAALDDQPTALAEAEALIEQCRLWAAAEPVAARPTLVNLQSLYAQLLQNAGLLVEAGSVLAESEAILQEYMDYRAVDEVHQLASIIGERSRIAGLLDDNGEALDLALRAVAIHRRAVAIDPDGDQADLVRSICTAANVSAALNRYADTRRLTREAVALLRSRVPLDPAATELSLAQMLLLDGLAELSLAALDEDGHRRWRRWRTDEEEAPRSVPAFYEATEILRRLASHRPDGLDPSALIPIALALRQCLDFGSVVDAEFLGDQLAQMAAELRPSPDRPPSADVLLAIRLAAGTFALSDQPAPAVPLYTELVRLHRITGEVLSPRDYADDLYHLGEALLFSGRPAEAVVALTEAAVATGAEAPDDPDTDSRLFMCEFWLNSARAQLDSTDPSPGTESEP
ncbi:hypothetical protein F4553_001999 [Allocatelliglobosispora scoriae]|uniref:Tetratricopeptide repeat protein n=1 Tax=Allocatelliglobosispora scoriae TaxID=643052 RepID=A0A841BP83_9ACTN|nr:serine protease [Allocatelliglobosispora scoriae]MBB5868620.1 hypothetical protein [Allocatelliglobosispora scoriae]